MGSRVCAGTPSGAAVVLGCSEVAACTASLLQLGEALPDGVEVGTCDSTTGWVAPALPEAVGELVCVDEGAVDALALGVELCVVVGVTSCVALVLEVALAEADVL